MRAQCLIPGATLLLMLTGCEYDRSFLHMDSNSGAPFLGLQLLVDADTTDTPPPLREMPDDLRRAPATLPDAEAPDTTVPSLAGTEPRHLLTSADAPIDDAFVPEAEQTPRGELIATSESSERLPRVRVAIPREKQSAAISSEQRLSLF